ncbi:hypothetical protein [Saliphagus sp. LR7]|uniref:hypothetical protein n=1 Tax=Saliphagus sp. LR7 TaxID=2282654 RepID=UPI000DF81FF0|nr:hypothetical protein [Saliphagus sp. LR7]
MGEHTNNQRRPTEVTLRALARVSPIAAQIAMVTAGVLMLIQPVVAQSAFEEAAEVACGGALGSAVFLAFGLLTLILILAGIAQIAIGFLGFGGGGRRGERSSIINGFVTLLGGLFLGSMSAVLDYLGINISGCLQGEILWVMVLI